MATKPIPWVGSSLHDLRDFPESARSRAGYQLYRIQQGLQPSDSKPMPTIGSGVFEIRIHTGRQHRVLYIAKFEEPISISPESTYESPFEIETRYRTDRWQTRNSP